MNTSCRVLLIGFVVAAGVSVASAQVPDNIPVDPEKSLADRQRERFEERHHARIARLFASTHAAVGPSLSIGTMQFDVAIQGGIDLPQGEAMHLAIGSRTYPVAHAEDASYSTPSTKTAYVFAIGYDVSFARFLQAPEFSQRSVLGFAIGGLVDEVGLITVDIGPKYVLPVNRFWSVPLGVKLSVAILGDVNSSVAKTFIGASVGVKRHFGQRRRLELK